MKRFNAKIDIATVTPLAHSIFNANFVLHSFLYTQYGNFLSDKLSSFFMLHSHNIYFQTLTNNLQLPCVARTMMIC